MLTYVKQAALEGLPAVYTIGLSRLSCECLVVARETEHLVGI